MEQMSNEEIERFLENRRKRTGSRLTLFSRILISAMALAFIWFIIKVIANFFAFSDAVIEFIRNV